MGRDNSLTDYWVEKISKPMPLLADLVFLGSFQEDVIAQLKKREPGYAGYIQGWKTSGRSKRRVIVKMQTLDTSRIVRARNYTGIEGRVEVEPYKKYTHGYLDKGDMEV